MDIRKKIIIFLLILIIGLSPSLLAAKITISIPGNVNVSQATIKLGEIARIEGVKGDELLKIQSLELGKSPLPGYEREITKQFIALSLQEMGYSYKDFVLNAPMKIKITTDSRKIESKELINFAKKYIIEKTGYDKKKVKIIPKFTPPDLLIPAASYTLEVIKTNNLQLPGDISLPVQVKIGDQVIKRVYLGFRVKIIEKVYIAKRNILKGERLKREDFILETREIVKLKGKLISDFNNKLVKDGIINTPLNKGDILTTYYLMRPVIISWGDEIEAEVVIGNIIVTTVVKALQSGRKGDRILVENKKTGHRFKAEVISSHLVRVIR